MNPFLIVPHYISWHYTSGISGFISLFQTFLWFLWHFFSIDVLLKTLFSPFQRLRETSKGKGLDLEAMFSALATTLLMRLIGFLFRSFIIALGLFSMALLIVVGIIGFIAWLLLPFLLATVIIVGLKALLTFSNTNI